ncbi:MAG: flavodoxin [Aeromonas popoffii]|jgi:flavodoxin|uniref:Flavodoxin n=1 Tax=Aeromonas popoffii TaxID=70856 RepID=A0ABS5GQX9_9GAMM|nr:MULTISPECIES: flavodoxin [Aeromonas]MBR7629538.1 flavodoxin [Aeromonas popoffii]MDF2415405.1 flavodoxin [Aeromonas sp. 1HA1]PTT50869.1 flavodoxin [Aeromonas sp. HMWF014]
MAQIDIVVGTVYGAAMLVAETLAAQLQQAGHECQIFDEAVLEDLDPSRFLLVITATTGQGDIPPNLQPFAAALADRAPYMKGWRYALIALGDSSYEHFCGAGRQLDGLLQELGARVLLPRLEIDATVDDEPEKVALAWLTGWENTL